MIFFILAFISLSAKANGPDGCLNFYNTDDAKKQVEGYYSDGKHQHVGPFVCDSKDCICMDGIDPEVAEVVIDQKDGGTIIQTVDKKVADKDAAVAASKQAAKDKAVAADALRVKIKAGTATDQDYKDLIKSVLVN